MQTVIISQYDAGLQMLGGAIEACPPDLWSSAEDRNRFWHVAYHVLFYTHLYLSPSEEEFQPWEHARPLYNFLGPLPWPPHDVPTIETEYAQSEIVEYYRLVRAMVAPCVEAVPLDTPSGFSWLPMDRFELHLYNLRHIAHHAGQLIDRVGRATGTGIDWVGMGRAEPETADEQS